MKKNRILAVVLVLALACGVMGVSALAKSSGAEKPAVTAVQSAAAEPLAASSGSGSGSAASADETVYVIAKADGSAEKVIVSASYKNATADEARDAASALKNPQLVKGDTCYQGETDETLPVTMRISYTLDGKTVSADELAGRSGRVTIRFDYENNRFETVDIDGKNEKIYVPFTVLTGAVLPNDVFSNVEVSNGKLIDDGDRTIVAGIAFPGLQESLALDSDKLELPDYVEITADVNGFELETTLTIITNTLFNDVKNDADSSELDSLDTSELTDGIGELTDGMNELLDGSSALYSGMCTLLESTNELSNGVNRLADGLDTLSGNSAALNSGALQVFNALLSTASTQIAASGLEVEELTVSNYDKVLSDVLGQIDSAGSNAEAIARRKVEAAVSAQEDTIRAAIYSTAEDQVARIVENAARVTVWNGVLEAAGLTTDTYQAGVEAGLISAEQQAMLNAALEQQMSSETVLATIRTNVAEQMDTSDMAFTLDQKYDEQYKLIVEQKMASDEVQSQITAASAQASEGAKSLRALKQQLDSYNAFYLGLASYTAGVDAAKDGAETLRGNMPALVSGVQSLCNGSMQLSDGLKRFNDEGISRLTDAFDGKLDGLSARLDALSDVSRAYTSFSGAVSDMDSTVKFVIRTDEISVE